MLFSGSKISAGKVHLSFLCPASWLEHCWTNKGLTYLLLAQESKQKETFSP